MIRNPRAFTTTLLAAALLSLPAGGPVFAQVGNVLSFVKQSDTQGTFTPPLLNGDELGAAAAGLGDLDGAGPSTHAVAVGAALDDDGGTDKGAVYILFLNSAGSILSSNKISATQGGLAGPIDALDEFGGSIAFLGDLDGPGPSACAIAVGAPGDDDGGTDKGAVYILFLSSTGTLLSQQKISGLAGGFTGTLDAFDSFGGAVAWLGDLDGHGKAPATLAVGAAIDDDGGADCGAVWVLFLDSSGQVLSHQKISRTAGGFTGVLDAFDEFGGALASLQDLDGAGPSTCALAVGAVFDDDGSLDRGAVWVLFLSRTGTVLSHQKISSTAGGLTATLDDLDEFGGTLANVGDMDAGGAGVTTLVVGAVGDDDGGGDRGAIHLLHLTASGTVSSSSKISRTAGNFTALLDNFDNFGSSVAFLGDLNGATAGGVTLAVGTIGDDDGGTDRGAFYILTLSGNPTVDVPAPSVGVPGTGLAPVRPNPCFGRAHIPFRLAESADVGIEIHDVTGRVVRRYERPQLAAGTHDVEWDGRDDEGRLLPAGTYFVGLRVAGRVIPPASRTVLVR
jgi:hypothetical protein